MRNGLTGLTRHDAITTPITSANVNDSAVKAAVVRRPAQKMSRLSKKTLIFWAGRSSVAVHRGWGGRGLAGLPGRVVPSLLPRTVLVRLLERVVDERAERRIVLLHADA